MLNLPMNFRACHRCCFESNTLDPTSSLDLMVARGDLVTLGFTDQLLLGVQIMGRDPTPGPS